MFKSSIFCKIVKFYQFFSVVLLQIYFGSGAARIRNVFFWIRIVLKVLDPSGSGSTTQLFIESRDTIFGIFPFYNFISGVKLIYMYFKIVEDFLIFFLKCNLGSQIWIRIRIHELAVRIRIRQHIMAQDLERCPPTPPPPPLSTVSVLSGCTCMLSVCTESTFSSFKLR